MSKFKGLNSVFGNQVNFFINLATRFGIEKSYI